MNLPIRIRPANEEDVPFIFNSWLKSYRTSPFGKKLSNSIFYPEHHKLLERLLKTSSVLVACSNNDPSQIYGYICTALIEGIFTVHYIYVKHTFRKLGIAKVLYASVNPQNEKGIYTHNNYIADNLSPKYQLLYHPYILFNDHKISPQLLTDDLLEKANILAASKPISQPQKEAKSDTTQTN